MVIAGVTLSARTVATLVRCLQREGHPELADDLGGALDSGKSELRLAPGEERQILASLDGCPAPLAELRHALDPTRRA
jgi:hypothetical protein